MMDFYKVLWLPDTSYGAHMCVQRLSRVCMYTKSYAHTKEINIILNYLPFLKNKKWLEYSHTVAFGSNLTHLPKGLVDYIYIYYFLMHADLSVIRPQEDVSRDFKKSCESHCCFQAHFEINLHIHRHRCKPGIMFICISLNFESKWIISPAYEMASERNFNKQPNPISISFKLCSIKCSINLNG